MLIKILPIQKRSKGKKQLVTLYEYLKLRYDKKRFHTQIKRGDITDKILESRKIGRTPTNQLQKDEYNREIHQTTQASIMNV